ncbi:MAG: DUF86 domain-containing protein [Anaerolineales bacterium]|nr:DUF86 domain-containing protein [Anaerolineales bacterium]
MRQNRDHIYLGDIFDAIERIEGYTTGVKKKDFMDNFMMQDAVMRQIEIIGEASNSVSDEFQEEHQNLPWFQMRGIRNKIVHDYRGINLHIIWDTVTNNLPLLKKQVQDILGE